jgi:capsular polysaccharide biosynthesis protein
MDVTDAVAGGRQRIVGFADLIRIPLRRWRTVLAVTALVTLAVVAFLRFAPATYQATAVVVLRPVVTDPFTFPSSGADRAVNMTAENGIATGSDVIDSIARILGYSAEDVRDALSIEVPIGGQVMRFQYAAGTEQQAVIGANAAAETYLQVRERLYKQQRAALLLSYDNTAKQVTDQRKAAQKALPDRLQSDTSAPRVQAVLDQVDALNDQIAQLAIQRAKIASADLSPGAVTAPARTPVPSSHDAAVIYLIGALLGGALLGMIVAHAREAFDRRVRSVEQAADLSGLPSLGVVRSNRRGDAGVVAADVRYVALGVLKWVDDHPGRPVVVLSSRADEGRTPVAGHLAVAMAEAGLDVHLAAADAQTEELRRILLAAQLRTPPAPAAAERPDPPYPVGGGAARLTNRVDAVGRAGGGPMSLMPAGAVTPAADPGAQLATARSGGMNGFRTPDHGPAAAPHDPDATLVMSLPPTPVTPGTAPGEDTSAQVVRIGTGTVRLTALAGDMTGRQPGAATVLVDAPPADLDERGVRAAQSGTAVLVLARDRTRDAELVRLVERLRSADAGAAGFVLTGGGHA